MNRGQTRPLHHMVAGVTFWFISLCAVFTAGIPGCATSSHHRTSIKEQPPLPPHLWAGVSLRKSRAHGRDLWVHLPRGSDLFVNGRAKAVVLVGVEPEERRLHMVDDSGTPLVMPYDEIFEIVQLEPPAPSWPPGYAIKGIIIGSLVGASVGMAKAAKGRDEIEMVLIAPIFLGLGIGAGALVGGSLGLGLRGVTSRAVVKSWRLGPEWWQIRGGANKLDYDSGTSSEAPNEASSIEPERLVPDDPVCQSLRTAEGVMPPGCRCLNGADCASGLCARVDEVVAPEGRCTRHCHRGCPRHLVCLIPPDGGAAFCGPAP